MECKQGVLLSVLRSSMSNDETNRLGNACDVLYSRTDDPRIGGAQSLTSSGALLLRDSGKSEFHGALEEATRKQRRVS